MALAYFPNLQVRTEWVARRLSDWQTGLRCQAPAFWFRQLLPVLASGGAYAWRMFRERAVLAVPETSASVCLWRTVLGWTTWQPLDFPLSPFPEAWGASQYEPPLLPSASPSPYSHSYFLEQSWPKAQGISRSLFYHSNAVEEREKREESHHGI